MILTAILGGLALIGVILLVSPFRIRGEFEDGTGLIAARYVGAEISIQLPAGIWSVRFLGLTLRTGRFKPGRDKKTATTKEPKPRPKTRLGLSERITLLRLHGPVIRRALPAIGRLIGRLLTAWRLEDGRIKLMMGTGDPAHTGMLAGYAQAIRPGLQRLWPRLRIDLTPVFTQRMIKLQAGLTLRILPIQPVFDILRAVGSLPWRGLWRLKQAWIS